MILLAQVAPRAWLWAALVVSALALPLSAWVALEEAPMPADVAIAREVQEWDTLARYQALINDAGPWRFLFLAFAAALVALRRPLGGGPRPAERERRLALVLLGLAALLGFANALLKLAVNSPRPSAEYGLAIAEAKSSYGFPSGHVFEAVLAYGALALTAPAWAHPRLTWPVRALCLAVAALMGPARIVVGAHWPSDTLGGYLWGAAALCLALALARATARER